MDGARIQELAKGHYLETAHNLILVGGTGTGKTHLAIALGVAAIHHGKRIRFYNAVDLVNLLEREKAQGKAGNLAKQLSQIDAVILPSRGLPANHCRAVDELGYLPFPASGDALCRQANGPPDPYYSASIHLISQLYEKTSLIITTNLSFAEWVVRHWARTNGASMAHSSVMPR